MANAIQELADPYAAIRTMDFQYTPGGDFGGVSEQSGMPGSIAGHPGFPDVPATYWFGDDWRTGQFVPFGSKYEQVRDLGDGRLLATMQQPGGHKYDTMQVIYRQGLDGRWVMEGEPQATRQISSGEEWRDTAEAFIPMALMAAGGAAYGAYGGGAGSTAGGISSADAAAALGGAGEASAGTSALGSGAIAPLAEGTIAPVSTSATTIPAVGSGGVTTGAGGGMDWLTLAGQLGGAYIQDRAVSGAAEDMRNATQASIEEQRRQYDQTRQDFAPWRTAGVGALGQLQTDINRQPTPEEVMATPGYQFGLNQGQQAIDRKIAAMGGRVSGQAIKAAARFGTDYATSGYNAAYQRGQDRLNRLAAIAGIGQTATGSSAQAGMNATNAISGLIGNQGEANAGGQMARGNIWGNAFNQGVALYGNRQQQQQPNALWRPGYGSGYNSYGQYTDWTGDH